MLVEGNIPQSDKGCLLKRRGTMKKTKEMEVLFLPTEKGTIKLYVFGFKAPRSLGRVIATYHDVTFELKGYKRNKTIIKALAQIHEAIVNNQDI